MGKSAGDGPQKQNPAQLTDLAASVPGAGREEMLRLARAVENSGLVDDEMLHAAMNQLADESAVSLKRSLIDMNLVTEDGLLDAVAADLGFKRAKLDQANLTDAVLDLVSAEVAKEYRVVPVSATEDEICLALSDPSDLHALDDLARILGKRIVPLIATEEELDFAIRRYYEGEEYASLYEEMAESEDPGGGAGRYKDEDLNLDPSARPEEAAPVVQFVDLLVRQAVHERASDIHLEPIRGGMQIRVRIDGVLTEYPAPPSQWQAAIVSRIKVLAGLDLAEKRLPLDGRIKLTLPGRKLDLRVATLPTIHGESIEMRILDQGSLEMGLPQIGFVPELVHQFTKIIHTPNGIVLVCGPTGCGKTTTLYAALQLLNTPEHKIMTLEDPVEYLVPGINQVQVNPEIGLNFPAGLRGMLRQSPDIMLVGEIRDMETAENAIRAALTGHLVFSSLHTNDAPSAMMRLVEMGVKPYLVAGSVQAILAQRLVRRICPSCKKSYKPRPEEILMLKFDPEQYADVEFFKGEGCERCNHGGYRGRVAVLELLVMDQELRRRVIRGETAVHLRRYAVSQGMRTLRLDGWDKIVMGLTTPEEIYTTIGDED